MRISCAASRVKYIFLWWARFLRGFTAHVWQFHFTFVASRLLIDFSCCIYAYALFDNDTTDTCYQLELSSRWYDEKRSKEPKVNATVQQICSNMLKNYILINYPMRSHLFVLSIVTNVWWIVNTKQVHSAIPFINVLFLLSASLISFFFFAAAVVVVMSLEKEASVDAQLFLVLYFFACTLLWTKQFPKR